MLRDRGRAVVDRLARRSLRLARFADARAAVGGDDDGNKKMMIWAIVAAVGMLSVAAVAVVYFLRPQPQGPQPGGVGVDTSAAAVAQIPQQPVAPAPAAPAAPSEGELAAQRAAAEQHGTEKSTSVTARPRPTTSTRRRRPAAKRPAPTRALPEPETRKAAPAATKSGPKSIDELLDGALGSSSAREGGGQAGQRRELQPARYAVTRRCEGCDGCGQTCGPGLRQGRERRRHRRP